VKGSFSEGEEAKFADLHGRYLNQDDHARRLDNLLWERKRTAARRMYPRVSPDLRKVTNARILLQTSSPGVDEAVNAVAASLSKDPGLLYDRIRWRRLKQKHEGAVELLLEPPDHLVRPDRWWYERHFQIRRLIDEAKHDQAYQLAARHSQLDGDDYAEAEWLAGWLALRFAKRPKSAYRHFVRMYDRMMAPVRQARAAYWAGRAAAGQGDQLGAVAWYRRAARHGIAYHGQLAEAELGEPVPSLPMPEPDEADRAAFEASDLVQTARLLIASGAADEVEPLLMELTRTAETAVQIGMIADLGAAADRPVLLARVGRRAAYNGQVHEHAAFPIPRITTLIEAKEGAPDPALLLGLARQESMFDTWVSSHAGARGLLQIMPGTARVMAEQLGEPFNPGRLVGDPAYNIRLGSHFLKQMLERYDGEPALALAAYNAGPRRVDRWMKEFGDPRSGGPHALVDWIEQIPFDETRNYVQRVLEGYRVYKRRLGEATVVMVNYPPVNGPINPIPIPNFRPGGGGPALVAAEPRLEGGTGDDLHRPALKPTSPIPAPRAVVTAAPEPAARPATTAPAEAPAVATAGETPATPASRPNAGQALADAPEAETGSPEGSGGPRQQVTDSWTGRRFGLPLPVLPNSTDAPL
jgi:soluble lytic murein transglycosylase